jgi:hypothetical protein
LLSRQIFSPMFCLYANHSNTKPQRAQRIPALFAVLSRILPNIHIQVLFIRN